LSFSGEYTPSGQFLTVKSHAGPNYAQEIVKFLTFFMLRGVAGRKGGVENGWWGGAPTVFK